MVSISIFEERERARRLLEKTLDAAGADCRRFPQIHAAASLSIAETHKDFAVREYAIFHYMDIVEERGLAATTFDLRKLRRLAEHAPAPAIRRRAEAALADLNPPDRFALRHELDRRLNVTEGFSRITNQPPLEDIPRYTEGCIAIACAEGDVKMRITALEAWQRFLNFPHPPEQEKRLALLARDPKTPRKIADVARIVLDNVALVRRAAGYYLEPPSSLSLH